MARIRTVKPEFWRHPIYARLPDDVQLLALSLLTMADDEGYFRAEPELIRGDVQPFRENLGKISRGLRELSNQGWIEVQKHPKQGNIGRIVNFAKHQRVHHPTPSKLKSYFSRENFPKSSGEFPPGTGNMIKIKSISPTPLKKRGFKKPKPYEPQPHPAACKDCGDCGTTPLGKLCHCERGKQAEIARGVLAKIKNKKAATQ